MIFSKFRFANYGDIESIYRFDKALPRPMLRNFVGDPAIQFLVHVDGLDAGYIALRNVVVDGRHTTVIQRVYASPECWDDCWGYISWLAAQPPYPYIECHAPNANPAMGAGLYDVGFVEVERGSQYTLYRYTPPERPPEHEVWEATRNRISRYF